MKYGQELQELELIAKKNGGILRPQDVIDYARDEGTALHNHFDWNDTSAAEKWRMEQARQIIRISVTMIDNGNEKAEIRAFVSLKPDRYNGEGGGYRPMVTVLSREDMREQMLADALEELESFREKYDMLTELSSVMGAINSTLKDTRGKRKIKHKRQNVVA